MSPPGEDSRAAATKPGLTHLDAAGNAVMVDVSAKPDTERAATARGRIDIRPDVLDLIVSGNTPKGDVIATARIAGLMAGKKTSDLIPLCHPIFLTSLKVFLKPDASGIEIEAVAKTTGPTGVEMEALTAVTVCALTVYDMCKALDRTMRIGDIRLMQKSGGRSGTFVAPGESG
ncbi:cyclic pyranopterin monophosphate synthase MoaC [Acetobacter oeni]|uniref:Cyclic pyranopterin monophosphate synthase n=1 Tax=Acetobacter oeni TaxID=304077 RepID=A0A511XIH9_9PROT|nr:cyclic pyranopterin monophosphate synthase MoaC [Acetobacter oeni]MBB3881474.1 cyclic pyranopterin phosphate synthase [Acetobacter oeni]NHO18339.1 cyclic pyranopterin monophosphate synthase MoaC [Acetobacter oeni]GBR10873.1 molybdopterin biosynthesis protein MoaC [Acetobacter oeni LMG 21952]GEN62752.1 cyclic pyranopterin monophosphate synthase accessory protein [Acetobacter oeni]